MFGKLKEIIGLGEYDEEFDELEETEEEQSEIEPIIQNTHGTKVVNIHSNNAFRTSCYAACPKCETKSIFL